MASTLYSLNFLSECTHSWTVAGGPDIWNVTEWELWVLIPFSLIFWKRGLVEMKIQKILTPLWGNLMLAVRLSSLNKLQRASYKLQGVLGKKKHHQVIYGPMKLGGTKPFTPLTSSLNSYSQDGRHTNLRNI